MFKNSFQSVLILSSAVFILFTTGCAAARGAKLPPPAAAVPAFPTPAAIRYSLPKTTIALQLQVERSSQSPGKYCDFLDLFFPEMELVSICQTTDGALPGVGLADGKMTTAIQGYSVTLKGSPDASRTHDVDFDASWHVERTDSMTFTESGTLTGADMQRTDRTAEIVFGVLSNAAKIAGRFVFGAGSSVAIAKTSGRPWERLAGVKENFGLLDKERQKTYLELWNKDDGKARLTLAARSYEDIVHSLSVLDGVLGGIGAQGALTLVPELRKQVADRMSGDFLGAKTKDTWSPTYEITPEALLKGSTASELSLFKFAGCGVSIENIQPVTNTLSALACPKLNGATDYEVKFKVRTASGKDTARITYPDNPPSSADGVLFYIRPEATLLNLVGECRSSVILSQAPKNGDPFVSKQPPPAHCAFADQSSLLAQWGVQAMLPKAGKDWAYAVTLYEATGALKSVKLASKALLDKGTVDTAFGIANTLLDAKDTASAAAKKKADDAATKADTLNVLTRSRQILEEKAKISKLCQDLGLTSCEY